MREAAEHTALHPSRRARAGWVIASAFLLAVLLWALGPAEYAGLRPAFRGPYLAAWAALLASLAVGAWRSWRSPPPLPRPRWWFVPVQIGLGGLVVLAVAGEWVPLLGGVVAGRFCLWVPRWAARSTG